MADDVRRPPGDNAPTPQASATRARNRTMVMGSERVGHMRAHLQEGEQAQIPQHTSEDPFHSSSSIDAHDPLGLESSDHHDGVSEDKTLQALDEIFDIGSIEHAAVTVESEPHHKAFSEPDIEAFDAPEPDHRALTEIIQPAPMSVARIVRPGAVSVTQAPPAPAATTVSVPPAPAPVLRAEPKATGEIAMSEQQEEIFWKVEGPLVGFLVSYDNDPRGTYVELRTGRLIVSSQQEDSGNCLVIRDSSVSPMHAIMRVAPGGIVQVLDQLSESGTRVRHIGHHEEVFLSGEKATVAHGDVVFFGERKFHVLLVLGDGE